MSLPSWERGLKRDIHVYGITIIWSLPSWERGLKRSGKGKTRSNKGRSLRGSVD